MKDYPRSTYRMEVQQQYRNMKQVIDRHPEIIDYAIEGDPPRRPDAGARHSIRGGTDGSRLSFMGLPCPNIFAGEHAFHSRLEWVSRQDMEKAVQTIVHLAMIGKNGLSNFGEVRVPDEIHALALGQGDWIEPGRAVSPRRAQEPLWSRYL